MLSISSVINRLNEDLLRGRGLSAFGIIDNTALDNPLTPKESIISIGALTSIVPASDTVSWANKSVTSAPSFLKVLSVASPTANALYSVC